ncbi:SGNH hydrolase domain-containing protein [Marinobacterium sp. xm-g-59]|uniref:SGNH hydrolase domain-containing protein n=1 Tax=Marinobacterium sp. xm-g-59 TaxID=2497748 RepID=UPI00352E5D22
MQTLLDAGKTVVYLWDVPNLGFTERSCLPRTGKGEDWKPENCVISRKDADIQLRTFSDKLNQTLAKFPNVKQVHLYEGLCDSERCLGATDEHLLYTDDDHLSTLGSKYVIGNLAGEIEKALREK